MTSVEQGRAAFARRAWGDAFVAFAAAAGAQLEAVDQERLAADWRPLLVARSGVRNGWAAF